MTTKELIGATDAAGLLGLSRAGFNLKCQRGEIMTAGRIGKRGVRVFDREYIEGLAENKGEK
ncbi:hypothetical protein ACL1FZ_08495 [Corynebacterium striatum]